MPLAAPFPLPPAVLNVPELTTTPTVAALPTPLLASVSSSETWDQSKNWTLVSAGDIMGDRGVRTAVEDSHQGPDYLLHGGTAKVTRIRCCSFFGYQYPTVARTGNAGAVQNVIENADFAMANLETGVLANAPFHAEGFTFTTDRGELDKPETTLPILDGGFDQLQLAIGVEYRFDPKRREEQDDW